MDKCPYCGADTRPGDNFCLNCGNRLHPATPSAPPQQVQPVMGDATLAAPEDWGVVMPEGGTTPASNWGNEMAAPPQIPQGIPASFGEQPTYRSEQAPAPAAQATIDKIEHPARFILRSETGTILQEYPLDKPEVVIGRAPSSDILLSKDKLTSRRHATVYYENGRYMLRDERSANGTFVNGQQLEEGAIRELKEGDHVGIGEHELVFRVYASPVQGIEDIKTMVGAPIQGNEVTYRTNNDTQATVATHDDFSTLPVEENEVNPIVPPSPLPTPEPFDVGANGTATPATANADEVSEIPSTPPPPVQPEEIPAIPSTPPVKESPVAPASTSSTSSANIGQDGNLNFNRLTSLPQPALPDLTSLIAALNTLDGQISVLQNEFKTTQDALRNHDSEIAQTSNQLRAGIRRVSDRMDSTIVDVAKSREALAWAELLQLMEDVMNNPRDIEYVTKLARKARELNKVFQIHQNVLNTMAECNSLLRSMIGDEK